MFAEHDKHYPSRSGQTSLTTAVANITKPVTKNNFGPSTWNAQKWFVNLDDVHKPFPVRFWTPPFQFQPLTVLACIPGFRDCQWGDWSPWRGCSVTCGNGTQTRTRDSIQCTLESSQKVPPKCIRKS